MFDKEILQKISNYAFVKIQAQKTRTIDAARCFLFTFYRNERDNYA